MVSRKVEILSEILKCTTIKYYLNNYRRKKNISIWFLRDNLIMYKIVSLKRINITSSYEYIIITNQHFSKINITNFHKAFYSPNKGILIFIKLISQKSVSYSTTKH